VATTPLVFTPDELGAFLETDDLLNRQFTFGRLDQVLLAHSAVLPLAKPDSLSLSSPVF
jgi:hypothetical protein